MSDKRFELTKINPTVNLSDTVYFIIDYENPNKEIRTLKDCIDLLNEQQATIEELERKLKKYSKIGEEQLKHIIELQDLCGQSDSENAKLRIENKKLKAKLREKEEDERLYADEIVKLNKEAKEVLDFKSLGGDY